MHCYLLSRRVTSLVPITKLSPLDPVQEEEEMTSTFEVTKDEEEEEIVFHSASYRDQRRESLLKIPVDNAEWRLTKEDDTK